MLTEPKIVAREAQTFAFMRVVVPQPEIGRVAPPLVDQLIAWIEEMGGTVAGRSFFNYPRCYSDGGMEVIVGVPTTTMMTPSGEVSTAILPAGRYASLHANVDYHQLHDANRVLGEWVEREGLELDGRRDGQGSWSDSTRLEIYHLDPGEHPSGMPVTEIAFRLMR
ncbi:GyrI-like domain-containing protein [Devosia sp. MC521]|uniref:GyrI-like domain-containing protein n=1 Tax=Devosia sp. MC521 TaxID=2759954 RepID=UPI0015FA072C|nr:GyrI-like domain-containing protein [Devosia sp. MC521]MBJ6988953.1 GyrI-like domain-containing protein [Devosia sp. MC521]QMW64386.1 GyrI-like domain-containing protein [Devosia sp. MC521]